MTEVKECSALHALPLPCSILRGWPWDVETATVHDTIYRGESWPRITVVTPSYNQAQFIEETIRSVLLQGYPNLEYIIIDGGSTDGSVEIIRKYEPWLTFWVSEEDRGQSHALNKGFRRATGEILAWLNSDDIYQPGALAEVAARFRAHPECGLIYADSRFIDDQSRPIRDIVTQQYGLESLVLSQEYLPQQSTFFTARAFAEQGALDEKLHYAMDFDLWLRLVTAYPYRRAAGVWSGFRLSASSKTVAQGHRFWPEIAQVLHAPIWQERIPADLHARALREAQFIAGIELTRAGDVESGIRSLDQSLGSGIYPFGGLLNCVYMTIDMLDQPVAGDVNAPNTAPTLAAWLRYTGASKANRSLQEYVRAVCTVHSYIHDDLGTARRLGVRAVIASHDFRCNPKLLGIVGKSLMGRTILNWGRAVRGHDRDAQ